MFFSSSKSMSNDRPLILVVDDAPANLNLLSDALEQAGYRIQAAPSGEVALRIVQRARPDLILLDIVMPGINGIETCRRLKQREATREIPVVFITAQDETKSLVEGFRAGGVDYITKPFVVDEALARVRTHVTLHRQAEELRRANEALRAEIEGRHRAETSLKAATDRLTELSRREAERWGLSNFIGRSAAFEALLEELRKLHQFGANTNVLITGESGSGKEWIARAAHYGGARASGPFVAMNCSAIPDELAESLLFGHVKGAFTGATSDRKGCFEQADGGSLFLDEIGDMPGSLQVKLLRVLETGIVTPVGGHEERRVDTRVIAATNAELLSAVAEGRFRNDLYFRLARFTIEVPSLRERREDIPLLAGHFIERLAAEMGMPKPSITPEAMEALIQHDYPGNIRELKNLIERALIETGGEAIQTEHLRFVSGLPAGKGSLTEASSATPPDRKSSDEDRILEWARTRGSINNTECRELLQVGMQRACYLLRKLHLAGKLERDHSGRWAVYRLAPPG